MAGISDEELNAMSPEEREQYIEMRLLFNGVGKTKAPMSLQVPVGALLEYYDDADQAWVNTRGEVKEGVRLRLRPDPFYGSNRASRRLIVERRRTKGG